MAQLRFGKTLVVLSASLLLTASPAWAHRLLMICNADGGRYRIEAFFDDDTPAQEAAVSVERVGGVAPVASGRTDKRGIWIFDAPPAGDYIVKVSSIGHQASHPLTVVPGPAAASFRPSPEPSHEELTRVPWVRVGIGLVLIGALCAVVLWWRKRSSAPSTERN